MPLQHNPAILPKLLSASAESGSQWNCQDQSQPSQGPRADGTPCSLHKVFFPSHRFYAPRPVLPGVGELVHRILLYEREVGVIDEILGVEATSA